MGQTRSIRSDAQLEIEARERISFSTYDADGVPTERAAIEADGTGTGWTSLLGGILPSVREFPLESYGAIQDGVADDSAAITAAVTAAAAVGGTVTYHGTPAWRGAIVIPTECGFVGPEASVTAINKLVRLDATAVLEIGLTGTGNGKQGADSGTITVENNGQNGTAIKIGRYVQTRLGPLVVINTPGGGDSSPAVLFQEAQNDIVEQLTVSGVTGPGVAVDLGAGNLFYQVMEVNNCGSAGTYQILIEQTGAAAPLIYTQPSQILLSGLTVERPASGCLGNISVTASSDVLFDNCVSASSLAEGVDFTHVSQQPDATPHTNTRLRFRDCRFQNNTANAGTIFDIGTGCSLVLEGRNVVQACKYLWKLAATASVIKSGPFALLWNNIGTAELDPDSVGTVEANVLGSQVEVFTANGSWTVPQGVKFVEITAVGGGGQGGGGGSATTSGGITNQVGGSGGGAAAASTQLVEVAPSTTLTIVVGAGGSNSGAGGAANNHAGTSGQSGSDSTVAGTGVNVRGKGGGGGTGSGANSTTSIGGGGWGTAGNTAASTSAINIVPGMGGLTSTARGETGGAPQGYSGGGGAGAAPASGTAGGGGGSAAGGAGAAAGSATSGGAGSTTAGASTTTAGVDGAAASANTGAGGGGGGGGAPGGAGGAGGPGGSGFVIIKTIA